MKATQLSASLAALPPGARYILGGPGDSGGPAILFNGREYFLMGNLTLERFGDPRGSFASGMGGNLIGAHVDYLEGATGGAIETLASIPEPGTCALLLAGLGAVGFAARRHMAR